MIGQTGLKKKTRKGMAALVLGANGPDIDVFFGSFPWEPLATHRGFTHGVIGALIVMPLIIAGSLWLLDRWQVGRGEAFEGRPAMHFGWLLALSLIGSVTHPLLDLQTTYAVQLLSPFSTVWYHTDTLFIIDVWLWLLLGGTLLWSLRREKRGEEWRKLPVTALIVMCVYIGANFNLTQRAKVYSAMLFGEPDRVAASPPPVAFYKRQVVWLDNGRYSWANYDSTQPVPLVREPLIQRSNMGLPVVQEAVRLSPEIQQFLRWSIMPFAEVTRVGCTARVTFNDARYSNALSRGNFERVVEVPQKGPGCP